MCLSFLILSLSFYFIRFQNNYSHSFLKEAKLLNIRRALFWLVVRWECEARLYQSRRFVSNPSVSSDDEREANERRAQWHCWCESCFFNLTNVIAIPVSDSNSTTSAAGFLMKIIVPESNDQGVLTVSSTNAGRAKQSDDECQALG